MMWKTREEQVRPQMTIWRMRIAWWVLKAANTYSEYAILIDFPLQHWLLEISSMLTLIRTLPVLLKHIFNKQRMTSEVYALCLDTKSEYDRERAICCWTQKISTLILIKIMFPCGLLNMIYRVIQNYGLSFVSLYFKISHFSLNWRCCTAVR
jgi:hypothetical protein